MVEVSIIEKNNSARKIHTSYASVQFSSGIEKRNQELKEMPWNATHSRMQKCTEEDAIEKHNINMCLTNKLAHW